MTTVYNSIQKDLKYVSSHITINKKLSLLLLVGQQEGSVRISTPTIPKSLLFGSVTLHRATVIRRQFIARHLIGTTVKRSDS